MFKSKNSSLLINYLKNCRKLNEIDNFFEKQFLTVLSNKSFFNFNFLFLRTKYSYFMSIYNV